MNNTNQNHTDNFFKQVLNSPPELKPTDKNWMEMERLLKPEAQRKPFALIYPMAGIAAALLVFFSWWLISDHPIPQKVQEQAVNVANKKGEVVRQSDDKDITTAEIGINKPPTDRLQSERPSISRKSAGTSLLVNNVALPNKSIYADEASVTPRSSLNLHNPKYSDLHSSLSAEFTTPRKVESRTTELALARAADESGRKPESRIAVQPGRWALSIALSPDVNSVKGFDNGDLGLSMGMGVSYRLGNVLSVGTGVYYSEKLYSADKSSYKVTEKPFATWTSYSRQIDADCKVLDIPLNLTVRMSNKAQSKVYATAGLSSYLMLSEKYDFIYNGPSTAYPTGRKEYTLHNENKHLLSVVNLGVALEKPISNQVSLVVQPYAKLPLTGIGQGQIDLKSVGLGFKLNYSLKKR